MTAPEPHDPPTTRRARRDRALDDAWTVRRRTTWTAPVAVTPDAGNGVAHPLARHAAPRSVRGRRAAAEMLTTGALAAVLVLAGTTAVTAAVLPAAPAPAPPTATALAQDVPAPVVRLTAPPPPMVWPEDPIPEEGVDAASGIAVDADPCTLEPVATALAAGDDAGVIAAVGGASAFREGVAAGALPCVALDDPGRVWLVVNKLRPYAPIDVVPSTLIDPPGVRNIEGGWLREDAAAALAEMVAAAEAAGVGEIALESAYRSYATQTATYDQHVAARGREGADLVSARPGHSEHQSGLAADVVACDGGCGTLDDLAATAQGAWVAEHAWEFGWIVRYTEGATEITGYVPEPWHLRYIGRELAAEYRAGQWRTLEEFFGLPAAPGYDGG